MAMVDDHTHSMGMKWNMMLRMKNHVHSVCTILHEHKVREGDVFV